MTIETQEPLIENVEIEIIEINDGIDDIPDMVMHIFISGKTVALCGAGATSDPHSQMHNGSGWALTPPGTRFCPTCGAPACPTCFELNV